MILHFPLVMYRKWDFYKCVCVWGGEIALSHTYTHDIILPAVKNFICFMYTVILTFIVYMYVRVYIIFGQKYFEVCDCFLFEWYFAFFFNGWFHIIC